MVHHYRAKGSSMSNVVTAVLAYFVGYFNFFAQLQIKYTEVSWFECSFEPGGE